jgi:Cytochrome C oxidase subunit II, periplasmic domain/Cytochrome c
VDPGAGGKADAVPGHGNHTWFRISKEGVYRGVCAELCGYNHADMRAAVRAVSPVFYQRCSGCHSLRIANSYGSANPGNFASQERTNGPNFNVRHVTTRDALYAIRNGGFSGTIMPANIVTGRQAERVAKFLGRYSGREEGGGEVSESGEQTP